METKSPFSRMSARQWPQLTARQWKKVGREARRIEDSDQRLRSAKSFSSNHRKRLDMSNERDISPGHLTEEKLEVDEKNADMRVDWTG